VAEGAAPATIVAGTRIPCYTDPVANLTLTIDDETLRRARIRALEEGTSVNALVREYLERFADAGDRVIEGRRRVVELARASTAGADGTGRAWAREEIYEERVRWPRS
jgi:plasmid stability protein